jgi:hypothetical protein
MVREPEVRDGLVASSRAWHNAGIISAVSDPVANAVVCQFAEALA